MGTRQLKLGFSLFALVFGFEFVIEVFPELSTVWDNQSSLTASKTDKSSENLPKSAKGQSAGKYKATDKNLLIPICLLDSSKESIGTNFTE